MFRLMLNFNKKALILTAILALPGVASAGFIEKEFILPSGLKIMAVQSVESAAFRPSEPKQIGSEVSPVVVTVSLPSAGFGGGGGGGAGVDYAKEKKPDHPPAITILSPNGGETWEINSTQTIKWDSRGISPSHEVITIRLRYEKSGVEYELLSNTSNDGAEDILVSSKLPVGEYRLEMKTVVNDKGVFDSSDSTFKITSPSPYIIVLFPQEGELLQLKSIYAVQFCLNKSPEDVLGGGVGGSSQVYLLDEKGTTIGVIFKDASSGIVLCEGSGGSFFLWEVGALLDFPTSELQPSNYKLRVDFMSQEGQVLASGISDLFKIAPQVVSLEAEPKKGIVSGDIATFVITSQGADHLEFSLKCPPGVSAPSTEGELCNITQTFSPAVTSYAVQLINSGFGKEEVTAAVVAYDASNNFLGLANASIVVLSEITSSITVLAPNGGEMWVVGEKRIIQWQSTGDVVEYGIRIWSEQKVPEGQPLSGYWTILDSSPANNGLTSYEWIVGNNLVCLLETCSSPLPEGQYFIQVFGYILGDTEKKYVVGDASDASFSIIDAEPTSPPVPVEPFVTVLYPNGGEAWHPGETQPIKWNSTGVNFVKIYIYDSNILGSGSTNYITPNNESVPASQGYFNWTIGPFGTVNGAPGSGGSNYRIRIDNADDPSNPNPLINDSSDAPFSITVIASGGGGGGGSGDGEPLPTEPAVPVEASQTP